MAEVYVKYNPYRMETQIKVNGKDILNDSMLYKVVKGKRLQEWVGKFPQMLTDELNTVEFDIEFYGMSLDWDDFEDAFNQAQAAGIIKRLSLKFIEGMSDENITDKIVDVFTDLQEGPVEDFRDPKLTRAFNSIHNSEFPVNVVATMSSGKSTLINALLQKKLMPSKNEACTATITEILDNDEERFIADVYDENGEILQEIPELTYEIMNELNDDEKVYRIDAEGNIPFLDSKSTALMLVDTPGPNNSQNQAHKNTTYRAISNDSNNLILYVLNGTQLSTNDDAALLSYVAEQIKKGGKQMRDRFLFVINKMDGFNPEEEDIGKAIQASKNYLASYGIEDPQIFPCSAYTALNIRTSLKGIDIDNLTPKEQRKLSQAAKDAIPMIYKFIDYSALHLEQYSTLSPSAQRELEYRLAQAEKREDTKEQALIHCGIYSIEAAITAYVKKYAKTKKVKDLVESFQEVLESNQVLAKAKTQVATDEEAAKACEERAAAVRDKIADGEEAAVFKERIAQLNPIDSIAAKAGALKAAASRKNDRLFEPYGDVITSKEEAKRLVRQFGITSSDSIAELVTELESVINREVMETGEKILMEYQEKLTKIDESATDKKLDFKTVDLIKGALSNMRDNAESWCSDEFASETVDDVGEVSYEENVYYKKVGQEEELIPDGTEQRQVGTRRVKVGSHREQVGTRRVKVGSHREQVGTRKVRNEASRGLGGFLRRAFKGEQKYIDEAIYETVDDYGDEAVYETVDDYKDEAVYETVLKYKTVMRDIFEEHIEKVEKFSAETSVIQTGLTSKYRRNLDDGLESALSYAQDQIDTMKAQFTKIFDELDELIQQKYEELDRCANDQKTKEAELEKNRSILNWIETCRKEIDEILDI